ncbi:MAG: 16S rRNA (uracil(1498)-N(3))-methyltransferase [Betaproteobacteria bacterium RIFCSPLOWO2_12_FULL_63_13]|nr:MAG: 16S rRNA (uracil(1498)-N(3))-methyltransferase [Betaproteobacteria bacterium RIFCSPLOWO2_12_FULL_63_13]
MQESSFSAAPRFYVHGPLAPGAEIELPERIVRHIAVLRLSAGDALTLFNGFGGEYAASLSRSTRSAARARVLAWRDVERESGIRITLAQGLCGGDRMDYAIQKATELGVQTIQPLATERSVIRLSDDRAERRMTHWRNVAVAACEQCGRNRPPEVRVVATLDALFSAAEDGAQKLMLAPSGTIRLRELPRADSVTVLIGPEGGLSENEEGRALGAGFTAVWMGPRVLRTETAPLAAIAALQSMWGDA